MRAHPVLGLSGVQVWALPLARELAFFGFGLWQRFCFGLFVCRGSVFGLGLGAWGLPQVGLRFAGWAWAFTWAQACLLGLGPGSSVWVRGRLRVLGVCLRHWGWDLIRVLPVIVKVDFVPRIRGRCLLVGHLRIVAGSFAGV